jgi:hypothetical protein
LLGLGSAQPQHPHHLIGHPPSEPG